MTALPVRAAIAAAVACACLLAPAAASAAPVLDALKPCYDAVSPATDGREAVTEPVTVSGRGFTPGALVDVLVDGEPAATGVRIDDAGALAPGTVDAPFVRRGRQEFRVTVAEQADASRTASATALVTRLMVRVRPRRAAPDDRVRFRGSGFTADAPVFAHYVRRGKLRRTVRLVRRPGGPCGDFSVRRRQFPFRPATGRWAVQLDQQRRYARVPETAFLRLRVDVTRARR